MFAAIARAYVRVKGRRKAVRTPAHRMLPTQTNDNRTFVQYPAQTSSTHCPNTDRWALQMGSSQVQNGASEDVVL
jgi:hypothetical protein